MTDPRAIAEAKPPSIDARSSDRGPHERTPSGDARESLLPPVPLFEALHALPMTPRKRRMGKLLFFYARRELPRFGKLLDRWGLNDQKFWQHAPPVEVRDKRTGHRLRLELNDFYQRIDAFLSGYHEFDVVDTIRAALRPGDVFLDGGANIGLITLQASHIVGGGNNRDGLAIACEPFDPAADRLRWHLDANKIGNIDLRRVALSDEPGLADVKQVAFDSLASSTLGPIPERFDKGVHARDRSVHACEVVRGDDLLADIASPTTPDTRPLFVKLDVEGFELRAIHGMREAMCHRRPAFLTELNSEVLGGQGHTPLDVFDHLVEYAYMPFAMERRGIKGRFGLSLHPLTRPEVLGVRDALWLTPNGPHWPRLRGLMRPPGQRGRA